MSKFCSKQCVEQENKFVFVSLRIAIASIPMLQLRNPSATDPFYYESSSPIAPVYKLTGQRIIFGVNQQQILHKDLSLSQIEHK